MSFDYDIVPPRAQAIAESLRAVGYNVQTAVADIIDNSIAAGSRNVWVTFHWDGLRSHVSIVDDGAGMSEDQLRDAMRLGSSNPLDPRAANDLGRFGLGLKTASFSQARRLVVSSKREAAVHTRCWDLDRIDDWRLLRVPMPGSAGRLDGLEHGTAVVWEKVDRLAADSSERSHDHFLLLLDRVKWHLSTTFHRWLEGRNAIKIWLNDRLIEALDPFLERELATQFLPEEHLTGNVVVKPFILPHHSKISKTVYEQAAGAEGWTSRQGFYIYRSRRLLVAGDWLGLGFPKAEHSRLVRIRVDLSHDDDAAWSLDIKKSRARPPSHLRDALKRTARVAVDTGTRVYRHRGAQLARDTTDTSLFVWQKNVRHGKVSYRINRDHPLVRRVGQELSSVEPLTALLLMIEEALPVAMILLDQSERPDQQGIPFETIEREQADNLAREMLLALTATGLTRAEAVARLKGTPVFAGRPALLRGLQEESS